MGSSMPETMKIIEKHKEFFVFQLSASFNMSIVFDLILTSTWLDLCTKRDPNPEKNELKMTFVFT